MKPIHYVLLTIAGIIILVATIVNWDKIKALFSPVSPAPVPEPEKSDFEKCVEKNKSLADGAPCTNCMEEGSDTASFQGVIMNGVCQPTPRQQTSNKIQITKDAGATTVGISGDGLPFSLQNAQVVPKGTVLVVTQWIPSPHVYYRTQAGWIDGDDAKVVA